MDKSEITDILEEIAVLLELKGENPFKARAYTNAARALDITRAIWRSWSPRTGSAICPASARRLQQKITELVGPAGSNITKLRASVPEGLLAMMEIPALGPKKIKALHEKLGITSVAELEAACQAQKVRDLPGFGAKTEEKISPASRRPRLCALFRYAEAWAQAEEIREALRDHEDVIQLSVAGSLRRGREVVKDLDFVASSRQPKEVMDYFVSLPG
jgi:DNA polymerase (family 10)